MSNKQYTPIIIKGEQYIQLVNPFGSLQWNNKVFNKANPPILWKGAPLAEGAVLDENEIERGWAYKNESSIWKYMPAHDEQSLKRYVQSRLEVRQVATLKVKADEPRKYPIGGYAPGRYHYTCLDCKTDFQGDKRASQCEPCAIKSTIAKPEGERGREEEAIDKMAKDAQNRWTWGEDEPRKLKLGLIERMSEGYFHGWKDGYKAASTPKEQPVEQPLKGMSELKIYKFQVDDLQNTLRLVANLLKSRDRKTCLDRDIMQCSEVLENVLNGTPEKRTNRF